MSNPLHKAPSTLLMDLLRLRTQGKQPDEFGTSVLPTIDLLPFYASDLLANTATSSTGAMPLTVTTTALSIPLKMVGVAGRIQIGANAGTRIGATVGAFLPGPAAQGGFFPLFQSSAGQGGTPFAGMEFWVGGKLPGPPVVFPPSAVLQLRVIGNQTGSDHQGSLLMMFEGGSN